MYEGNSTACLVFLRAKIVCRDFSVLAMSGLTPEQLAGARMPSPIFLGWSLEVTVPVDVSAMLHFITSRWWLAMSRLIYW